ncbi:MAG: glycosyltransferase family 9 protein [bacterium]|nr:glycosyltransferase family 9 protein [bacterium]
MSTPVLQVLRQGDPEIHLGFLAEEGHAQILDQHPWVDQIHYLRTTRRGNDASARSKSANTSGADSYGGWTMVQNLRSADYDLAVDLFFNPRSAWLLKLSGIPQRIGGTRGSRRFLYTHSVLPSESPEDFRGLMTLAPGGMGEHLSRLAPLVHVESGLGFLQWFEKEFKGQAMKPVLPLEFWRQQLNSDTVPDSTTIEKNNDSSVVVLAPGATWPSKEWSLDHWSQLIERIMQETDLQIWVLQPPSSHQNWAKLSQNIQPGRGQILPPLSLKKVVGILSQSSLLISVDGGIMHCGVGLGVPTLGLFGPSDDTLWFPYENSGPFRVVSNRAHCAPCDLHQCDQFICLPELGVEAVLNSGLELLKSGRG